MFNLHDKTALVTGVGSEGGIGFACAKALLEHGSNLIITSTSERVFDREASLEEIAKGKFGVSAPHVHAQIADLTDSDQVEYFFRGFESLDILVNNAGMSSQINPLHEKEESDLTRLSDEDWAKGLSRNLDTAFKVTREALPLLRKSKAGRIIFISSLTGGRMAMLRQPGYAAAKAGVLGLMRSIALDEARHGITCNAIMPGWIATDSQPAHEAKQGKHTPLGRSGTPLEIASAVLWLSSNESGFTTGQEIVIDGGNSIAEERAV